jgi:hypothetical protein
MVRVRKISCENIANGRVKAIIGVSLIEWNQPS